MPWERKPAEAPSNLEFNLSVVEAVHITHPLEEFVAVHDGNEALGEIELGAGNNSNRTSAGRGSGCCSVV